MISVQILEPTDIFQKDDWVRPLGITTMSGGHSDYYSFKSMYSGAPENNIKWVRAEVIIGQLWFGKTVGEYNTMCKKYGFPLEFIRGDMPKAHQLSMKGFKSLAKVSKFLEGDDDDEY